MDSMAKSVISKFNNNSERILNIMTKQQPSAKPGTTSQDFIFDSMERNDRKLYEESLKAYSDLSKLINNPDALYQRGSIDIIPEEKKAVPVNPAFQKNWNSIRDKLAASIREKKGIITDSQDFSQQNEKMMIVQSLYQPEALRQ